MREVNIGGKDYKVVASPITLFFYKKEFKSDLLGDLMSLRGLEYDPEAFDGELILRFAWAMIKTAKLGMPFPTFEQWLASLEYVNFEDTEMILNIVEEAQEGFFRGDKQPKGE
jgi:hypothetical protein